MGLFRSRVPSEAIGLLLDRSLAVARVLELIRAAFPEANPPSSIVADGPACGSRECREVDRLFRGVPWTQLTPQQIREYQAASTLMDDGAFRYYLPAFMVSVALGDEPFEDYLLYDLLPDSENGARRPHIMSRMTNEQCEAVSAWLNLIRARGVDALPVDVDFFEHGEDAWARRCDPDNGPSS